jgi:hypothetical protein
MQDLSSVIKHYAVDREVSAHVGALVRVMPWFGDQLGADWMLKAKSVAVRIQNVELPHAVVSVSRSSELKAERLQLLK